MSEVQTNPKTLKPMETLIRGRIEEVKKHEKDFFTRVICPALDAYSTPAIIELKSDQRLGERGDEITTIARVGGYRSYFQSLDKETGEISKRSKVNLTLVVNS